MGNKTDKQKQPRELFIEELKQVAGGRSGFYPPITTLAVGEENGHGICPPITSQVIIEEDGWATTQAIGEEDGGAALK